MKLSNPGPDRLPAPGGRHGYRRVGRSSRSEPEKGGGNGAETGRFGGWPDGIATWRSTTFGPASEEPYRRRVTDWTVLVFAAAVLAGLTFRADHPSAIEVDLFRLINGLPSQLSSTFRAFSAAGTLWVVGLVVSAALIGRRKHLARDLLLAGLAAWAAAHFTGALVAGDGFTQSLRAVSHVRGASPHFPLGRVAVVVAVVATAVPYVTRPTRRAGQVFVLLAAVAALYMGEGLPNDALGGLFLGLAIAAAVHLAFGSPGGRPTAAQVTAALAELGVRAYGLHLAANQPYGATLMVGRDQEGAIVVRVLGRDEADAQLLQKLWRSVVYKGSGPALYLTRLQEVEHSAYLSTVARDHGVRTPEVVVAGQAGPKAAVLVERPVPGSALADMGAAAVTDEVLVELWRQVGRLRGARVSHGNLDAAHVVVGADGPVIVGFGAASSLSASDVDADVVSLLVSTASIVGPERAVAALTRGLGADALPPVLPLLQPAALPRSLRALPNRRALKATLDDLRAICARAAGVPAPALQQLHRVSRANLLLALGTMLGVFALLSQVSNSAKLGRTLEHADWAWVALALFLSIATNVPYAVALMGTAPRKLPLWSTTELQLSMSFTNLAVPGVGGIASQVRFLQKQGIDLPSAVAAGGLVSAAASAVVNVAMLALALALSPHAFHFATIPVGGVLPVVLGVVLAAGLAAAVALGVPRLRRAVVAPVRQATTTVVAMLRSPRQLVLVVTGFAGANIAYTFCLLACLEAFGTSLSPWALLALTVGVMTASALVPVPGGGTALSAVTMSGLMTGLGLRPQVAVAAVLTHQLVVTYMPALPGWFAIRHLVRKDEL